MACLPQSLLSELKDPADACDVGARKTRIVLACLLAETLSHVGFHLVMLVMKARRYRQLRRFLKIVFGALHHSRFARHRARRLDPLELGVRLYGEHGATKLAGGVPLQAMRARTNGYGLLISSLPPRREDRRAAWPGGPGAVANRHRWHPYFGCTLRGFHRVRRADGEFVHVEMRPDVVLRIPAWMLDPVACAGMTLGVPRVGIMALTMAGCSPWRD